VVLFRYRREIRAARLCSSGSLPIVAQRRLISLPGTFSGRSSGSGQKAPFDGQPITSGLPPGANILGGGWHVSSVPGRRSRNWPRRIVVVPRPPSLYSSYMLRVIVTALVTLGFFVGLASVTRLPPSLAASGGETNPDMCNVVQAAFMAVMNSRDVAYPKEIGAPHALSDGSGHSLLRPRSLEKTSCLIWLRNKISIQSNTLLLCAIGGENLNQLWILVQCVSSFRTQFFRLTRNWRSFKCRSKAAVSGVMAVCASYEKPISIG
jgi:hypothetical protein